MDEIFFGNAQKGLLPKLSIKVVASDITSNKGVSEN